MYIAKLFKAGKTKVVTAADQAGRITADTPLQSAIYWYAND